MASLRVTRPDNDDGVIVTAVSPAAAGDPLSPAVASPPPVAQHGHYGKQPRDGDDATAAAPRQSPPPPPMMGYGYPPAIALHCLADEPAVVDCPFCGHRVQTEVEDHDSHMTILSGIGIGFLLPCLAFLPCCLGWFPDVDHYCPACQQRLAHVPYNLPAQIFVPAPGIMMMPPPPHPQHPPYAAGHGHPPTQAVPAPPQLARYA